MKRDAGLFFGAWGICMAAVACGSVATGTGRHGSAPGVTAAHPGHRQQLNPAGHGSQPAHTKNGRTASEYAANHDQGHHFEPRPQGSHTSPAVAPPPALSQLPSFIDGSSQCFQSWEDSPHPKRYSTPQYSPGSTGSAGLGLSGTGQGGGGYASGYGRVGGSHSAPAPSAALRPTPEPNKKARASSAQPSLDRSDSAAMAEANAPMERSVSPRAEAKDEAGHNYYRDDSSWSSPPSSPHDGYGQSIYLSNDDSMSLSSAQRVIYAIENFAPLPAAHIRPHELLNYFSFNTETPAYDQDFSVLPSIAVSPTDPSALSLGLAISGRSLTLTTRRNANLTFVVDRSGSMEAEGRMQYVKRGLLGSLSELKHGDIVNITLFDSSVCQLAQNFVVGRDSLPRLQNLIERVTPRGATNLYDGLEQGYQVANSAYQPDYSNRVILVTDALANTGVTSSSLISMVGKHYDERRIRLSGVGVGREFNDELLDQLTERGRGAYVFLGSDQEVDAVFGSRFVSLIETVANDVHFRLHLPPSLALKTFYGEEASTDKARVQAIHYFAGTSQMFLSEVMSRDGRLPVEDDIMVTIEYEHPETGEARVEEYAFNLAQIAGPAHNLQKAHLVSHFARSLQRISALDLPERHSGVAHSWYDDEGATACQAASSEMDGLAQGLQSDPEVRKVLGLMRDYCSRYASVPSPLPRPPILHPRSPQPDPGPPVRNNDYAPPDQWPSARR